MLYGEAYKCVRYQNFLRSTKIHRKFCTAGIKHKTYCSA